MGKPLRVLLIGDSEAEAALVLDDLTRGGYDPTHLQVSTGEAMVAALDEQTWDAVLAVVRPGEFGAPEALQLLRERDLDAPFICLVDPADEQAGIACMKHGAHDYVLRDALVRLVPALERELREAEVRREQKGAQSQLRAERDRTASIIDTADALVLGISTEGRITFFNRKCEQVTGYSASEVMGRTLSELAPGEGWLSSARDAFAHLRAGDSLHQFDYPWLDKEGKEHLISWRPAPIIGADGALSEVIAIGTDVTEQRTAEQRYRTLVETTGDGVILADADGTITYANDAALRMVGYDQSELLGQPAFAFVHEDGREASKQQLSLRAAGQEGRYEELLVHKSGRGVPVLVTATPRYDPHGQFIGSFTVIKDITQIKQAEQALRESEQRHRTLFEASPIAILEMDFSAAKQHIAYLQRQGVTDLRKYMRENPEECARCISELRVLDANKAGLELTGARSPRELSGNLARLFTEDTYEPLLEMCTSMADSEFVAEFETAFQALDGRTRHIAVRWSVAPDSSEALDRVIICALDVTEQKQAEARLERLRQQHQLLAESVVVGTFIIQDDRFVFTNETLNTGMGYPPGGLIGQRPRDLVHPDDRAFVDTWLDGLVKGESFPPEAQVRLINAHGETLWANIWIQRMEDQDGQPMAIGHAVDITQERELRRQLEHSSRLEAVGQLAGGMAHDFNNMLTVISGNAQLVLRAVEEDTAAARYASDIVTGAERASSLTRQLLAFSRRQVVEPKVLSLNAVITEIEPMLRHLIEESIDFRTDLDPELGHVAADRAQIEQVVTNLVLNARDAMPEGGRLTIETAHVDLDETHARTHPDAVAGPYVRLGVSDTGSGMDQDTQSRIFEPFFTTKEAGKGTGLGLATVYGIVKQSGGHIYVDSEPGTGTRFEVLLPRLGRDATPVPEVQGEHAASEGSETILLVEDEDMVRGLVVVMLEGFGYHVLTAAGGAEALRVCEQHEGPIHLMATDVVMPGMSGPEVAERAVRLKPEMKVLYVSGYTDDAISHHGALNPGTHLLAKPFEPRDLAEKIREILDAPEAAEA